MELVRISPDDGGQYFFGYYDLPAFSGDGGRHLCHRVGFSDRLPGPDDMAELGTLDLGDGTFRPFAETTAWNFQQGSMLQWHPKDPNGTVLYNAITGDGPVAVLHHLETGEVSYLGKPLAALSPTGETALSIDFGRTFDFRPGYGYAGLGDGNAGVDAPWDDGIWAIDTETGDHRLILSLAAMANLVGEKARGAKLLVNHITIDPSGQRFVALLRNFPKEGGMWRTWLLTAGLDGGNPRVHGYGMASHYHWRDPQHLLIWADIPLGRQALVLMNTDTGEGTPIDEDYFRFDGHCSHSPGGRAILYDSYPIEGFRRLMLYDMDGRRGHDLGSYHSPATPIIDIRCDLHPRWNGTGTAVSFDSAHEGNRHVYLTTLDSAW